MSMMDGNLKRSAECDSVNQSVSRAFAAIEARGVDTYDPFDVYGLESVQQVMERKGAAGKVLRKALYLGTRFAPLLTRKCLGTPKRATAGGVAALAMAYTASGGRDGLRKARKHLDWLLENGTRKDGYIGWGFPYGWKNEGALLPAGTPIGHTTMTCGNAFLRYQEVTGEDWAVEPVLLACEFFDKGLNKTEHPEGRVSVSYTPADRSQVINVSADIGSLLMRSGKRFNQEGFVRLAERLVHWVIDNQNPDGSWYYNSYASIGKASMIDNRHTGMVLSALCEVLPLCEPALAARVKPALQTGTKYFLEQLFTTEGLPKFFHNRIYPLEIYNFAQAIITLIDVTTNESVDVELRSRANETLSQLADNLLRLMQQTDGSFLYMRDRFFKTDLRSLRWANALTTFALARYLREVLGNESEFNSTQPNRRVAAVA